MKKILTLLTCSAIILSCTAAVTLNESVPENTVRMNMKACRDGSASIVVYGALRSNLTFVVFQNAMESVTSEIKGDLVAAPDGSLRGVQYLLGKRRKKIILNNSYGAYEIRTNAILQVRLELNLEAFESYLNNCHTNYSLDSMYRFMAKPLPQVKTIPR